MILNFLTALKTMQVSGNPCSATYVQCRFSFTEHTCMIRSLSAIAVDSLIFTSSRLSSILSTLEDSRSLSWEKRMRKRGEILGTQSKGKWCHQTLGPMKRCLIGPRHFRPPHPCKMTALFFEDLCQSESLVSS